MLPALSTGKLSTLAAAACFALLASCGGGGSDTAHVHDDSHAHDDGHDNPVLVDAPLPPADALGTTSLATVVLSDGSTETINLASAYTGLVKGTLYNTAAWPVWWGTGKPVDGVNCLSSAAWHKHALISIYKDGKRLGFPDGIGRVHAGCYHAYEMHVHDVTGILHLEANGAKNFKLGQWFSLWQQPLGVANTAGLAGPVRFYTIDNYTITAWLGDPKEIPILPHREILIVTGTKMTTVPKYQWPAGI
jgi:hypothetical protein